MKKHLSILLAILILLLPNLSMLTFGSELQKKNIIYVDVNGRADYKSIQDAIDNASDGDTIFVYSGTYFEKLIINKSLNIISENKTTTIIDGKDDLIQKSIIFINSDYLIFSGFTIMCSDTNQGSGIILENVNNCNISNNIFKDISLGINIRNTNYTKILENEFHSDNHIKLSWSNYNIIKDCFMNSSFFGRSILLFDSFYNTIKNNIFIDGGIDMSDSFNNIITENIVNGKPLVYLEDKSDVVIEQAGQVILVNCVNITIQHTVISHTVIGIKLIQSGKVTILNNLISFNFEGISSTKSHKIIIKNNTIEHNLAVNIGIYHSNTHFYEIKNNIIKDSAKGIYLWNCYSEINIKHNDISGNKDGIYIASNSCIICCNNIYNNYGHGIVIYESEGNEIYFNNFENNNINAYFKYFIRDMNDKGFNKWCLFGKGNYWDDWRGLGPHLIFGEIYEGNRNFQWLNFDFFPVKEPYDIVV